MGGAKANSPRPNTVSTIPTHIPTINARNAYLICKIKCSCFSFVIVNSFFNKNKEWLQKELKIKGYKNTSNILLATLDINEKLTVYEKNVNEQTKDILE